MQLEFFLNESPGLARHAVVVYRVKAVPGAASIRRRAYALNVHGVVMRKQPTVETILDSIADGVFTVDRNWKITSFNAAAEPITGVKREDAIGEILRGCLPFQHLPGRCAIAQSLYSGKPVPNRSITIGHIGGQPGSGQRQHVGA